MQLRASSEIWIHDTLIIVKASGEYCKEEAQDYLQQYIKAVNSLGNAKFKVLMDITEYIGATPEAYKILKTRHDLVDPERVTHLAIVTNDNFKLELLFNMDGGIILPKERIKVFSEFNAAQKWIDSE